MEHGNSGLFESNERRGLCRRQCSYVYRLNAMAQLVEVLPSDRKDADSIPDCVI
jgi:hypothetical protein